MKPWKLSDARYPQVKDAKFQVAVIPIGACEPHNFHLPYGTDAYESELVGERICAEATRLGASVVMLPTIPFGVQSNMLDLPLAINVYPTTLMALLKDIIDSLGRSGITKVAILNSHGGNDFLKPFIREMAGRSSAFICVIDWWRVGKDKYSEIFDHPDDHAGELETSVMLALRPDLVSLSDAGDGAARPTRFDSVNKGWVSISRPWSGLTQTTGVGDPRKASKEKGEKYLQIVIQRLSQFLAELSRQDVTDESFPF